MTCRVPVKYACRCFRHDCRAEDTIFRHAPWLRIYNSPGKRPDLWLERGPNEQT